MDQKIRKIFHDIRSRLSVAQTVFVCPDVFTVKEEDQELFACAKRGFDDVIALVNTLSQELSQKVLADNAGWHRLAEPAVTSAEEFKAGRDRVLVIDDDKDMRDLFARELMKRGKKVMSLTCGEELLKTTYPFHSLQMAIVDYQFENSALDGFDVIEYLRAKKVPNIHLCTGCYDDPEVIERARALDVVSVIAKPVPEHFWDAIV